MILEVLSATLCIVGALGAVAARNLMRGAAGLSVMFLGISGLFGAMGAGFLAAAQLFLFVGGVVAFLVLAFSSTTLPVARGRLFASVGVMLLGVILAVAILPVIPDVGVSPDVTLVARALLENSLPILAVAFLALLAAVLVSRALLTEEEP